MGFLGWAYGSYYLAKSDNLTAVLIGNVVALILLLFIQWSRKKDKLVVLAIGAVFFGANLVYMANYFFNNLLGQHQQDRINVWLRPELCDPRGALYNVLQSKMAIGSGGLQGKGFLQGTMTKLNYVPEQATDFIFCTIGEEQGFIGSFGIIALFVFLFIPHYCYCRTSACCLFAPLCLWSGRHSFYSLSHQYWYDDGPNAHHWHSTSLYQ